MNQYSVQFSSVAQSCLTLCDPMDCSMPGLPVHHQLPVYPNSCPLSRWCHPTISSSVTPFSSLLRSFPASQSFPMSQFFASGGQRIGVLASASVLPINIEGWFPLGLTGLISLESKGLSRVFSNTTVQKHQFFDAQPFFMVQLWHLYTTTRKTMALTIWPFVGKVTSLLFNTLSMFIVAFLPRRKQFYKILKKERETLREPPNSVRLFFEILVSVSCAFHYRIWETWMTEW